MRQIRFWSYAKFYFYHHVLGSDRTHFQLIQILAILSYHSMAGANLNKSENLVTNTTAASKYIRIWMNLNHPFQTKIYVVKYLWALWRKIYYIKNSFWKFYEVRSKFWLVFYGHTAVITWTSTCWRLKTMTYVTCNSLVTFSVAPFINASVICYKLVYF